jgi:hypothetical protein
MLESWIFFHLKGCVNEYNQIKFVSYKITFQLGLKRSIGDMGGKKKSYCNQHPTDQFLPLAIGVFGYLQKQIDVFSHDGVIPFGACKGY